MSHVRFEIITAVFWGVCHCVLCYISSNIWRELVLPSAGQKIQFELLFEIEDGGSNLF